MLVLLVAILLAVISVAAFPCWSYSARWGYLPSVIAGAMLLCTALIGIGGKSAPKAADSMELVSAAPATSGHALHRRMEADCFAPEDRCR